MAPRHNRNKKRKNKKAEAPAAAVVSAQATTTPTPNITTAAPQQTPEPASVVPPAQSDERKEFAKTFPSGRKYWYIPYPFGEGYYRYLLFGMHHPEYVEDEDALYSKDEIEEYKTINTPSKVPVATSGLITVLDGYDSCSCYGCSDKIFATEEEANAADHTCPRKQQKEEDSDDEEERAEAYCKICDFQCEDTWHHALHIASRAHSIRVPRCIWCFRNFKNGAGLASHLESGGCKAHVINYRLLHRILASRDPARSITSSHQELLPNYHNRTSNDWSCPRCKKLCPSSRDLYTHMNKEHEYRAYHCPNKKCNEKFTRFAGLLIHLESQICNYMSFVDLQTISKELFFGHDDISVEPVRMPMFSSFTVA